MKRALLSAVLALCILRLSGLAQSPEPGFYTRVETGLNMLQDTKIKNSSPARSASFDPGFRVDLAEGYQFNRWFGLEFNPAFLYNGSGNSDESLMQIPMLLNAVFQYHNASRFVPYVGLGAGTDLCVLNTKVSRINAEGRTELAEERTGAVTFAWQAMVGVRYTISEFAYVSAAYHYLGSTGPSWLDDTIRLSGLQNHSFMLGITVEW